VSLGLRLRARLAAQALEPQRLMDRIENWVRLEYAHISPKTRQGLVEVSPTVFCVLHPAAEEIELSLIDPQHVVASANTSTVGPGYHAFVASLLQHLARDLDASWERPEQSSEEYCDETEYFFTGDEKRLFDGMASWLRALANSFFDGSISADDRGTALCMPMDIQFENEQIAVTPLGPRTRDWLHETAQDGTRGKDFFAWWTPGFTAEYYLGRALAQMWSSVRWRSPIDDSERNLLKDVSDSLHSAYRLNPTLRYPWAEWKEILELLDGDAEDTEFVRLHASGTPTIGYRRGNVKVSLPGGWRMRIPGSFSDFVADKDNNLCALDPPREIWFTSYRFTTASHRDAFELMRKQIESSRPDYLMEGEGYIARATISKKHRETGEEYFVLNSSNVSPTQRAVCTILFSLAEQEKWALDTWRSIQPPSMPNT
jgi:hypothetical protein